ncbi:hypothetical protein GCM10009527_057860 [Actinomadura nitritigenes]
MTLTSTWEKAAGRGSATGPRAEGVPVPGMRRRPARLLQMAYPAVDADPAGRARASEVVVLVADRPCARDRRGRARRALKRRPPPT